MMSPEVSSATLGTEAPDGVQCVWEAPVLRWSGAGALLSLPSCPIHKAHYHFKGLETPSVPRMLMF